MNKTRPIAQLKLDLQAIFAAFKQGNDVSPATRYRTEGFARGLMAAELLTEREFARLMADAYQQCFERPMPESLCDGVHIPSCMKRAPVYPST